MIPGMFTMGNAVCGFLAILSLFDDQVVAACWFVILAGFLDALDGKVARLSGVNSQFGRELDSLADFVSFGVAPAAIVHVATLSDMGRWGWVISIVFIMAAAYRLARFNLLADDEEKKAFLGLPVPAAGFALVTFVIFSFEMWGELRYDQVLIGHSRDHGLPDGFTGSVRCRAGAVVQSQGTIQASGSGGGDPGGGVPSESFIVSLYCVVYIIRIGARGAPSVLCRDGQSDWPPTG